MGESCIGKRGSELPQQLSRLAKGGDLVPRVGSLPQQNPQLPEIFLHNVERGTLAKRQLMLNAISSGAWAALRGFLDMNIMYNAGIPRTPNPLAAHFEAEVSSFGFTSNLGIEGP
ncbi:hypothetical protein PCH_Pc12g03700 [Penicillium rubens Wisconsin 54-1255]|uniref:Uncharacterized protein n=1 Tax=Penicillium rubens (strain ATCC 28089 / DSM 1075 / NRRL 1951 / Wisconsin 54-1255) TaxID=500485 RepID=B6GWZ1_PENRW|nr:hypothetical protein PCH_Pc12g03700 [Penicillium rubens Wisconsin 54-1255]